MITISFEHRLSSPLENRQFYYSHTAKSWLLLSGFLPLEDSNDWVNAFTGVTACLSYGVES